MKENVALHQYLKGVITNIPFGIVTLSKELEVSMLNSKAVQLLGYKNTNLNNLIDNSYKDIFKYIPKLIEEFELKITSKKDINFDLDGILLNDLVLNIKCRKMLHGILFIIEDFTKHLILEHQAYYDSLTNLLNREQLEIRINNFAKRNSNGTLFGAIIFMDLDRFKPVNDSAGHKAGDELLKQITDIMKDSTRDKDTLARVGGDEFVLFLENCPLERAAAIAEKIRQDIDDYVFTWEEESYSIGVSAGISVITHELEAPLEAINIADQACLIAKDEGRNRIHIADDMRDGFVVHKEEVSWINVINKAIKDDDFILYKQEIREITQIGDPIHYELLLRLKNAQNDILSPAVFMPSAERYDLMTKIDMWVVEKAFSLLDNNIKYSINLSGQTLSNPDFASFVIEMEKKYKINPKMICFEITETMAIKFLKNTKFIIETLTQRGYGFGLDDFGTGLSSYAYLKKMTVACLKIDGMFTKEIVNDKVSYTMVKSINEIGHVMGLKTVAEFVEDKEILEALEQIGVDYAQGYHIHKPEAL